MKTQKKLHLHYDKESDFLELRIGHVQKGHFIPSGDECFERVNEKGELIGFAIFNFTKRSVHDVELPLQMTSESKWTRELVRVKNVVQ